MFSAIERWTKYVRTFKIKLEKMYSIKLPAEEKIHKQWKQDLRRC